MTPLELSGLVTGVALLLVAVTGLISLARARRRATDERTRLGDALAASEAVSAALSEEALFLSAVLSAVDAVIILFDRSGRVRFVNERFEEVFGIRGADVIGRAKSDLHALIGPCFADPEGYVTRAEKDDGTRTSDPRPTRPSGQAAPDEAEFVVERPSKRVLLWSRFPVAQGKKQIGVLAVFRDITGQRHAEQGREKLMTELAARATTDALTMLANRRAASDALQAEIERARRYNRPLSVVLFDLDHFKRINDDFGHETGDIVLRAFADVLRATARSTDVVSRWGGEEFLAILHEAEIDAARAFAERVRTGLAAIQPMDTLRGKDGVVRTVTVSGGATVLAPSDGDSADSLVRRADEALYEAKRNGRDRIAAAATPSTIASGGTVDRSRRSRPPGPT